jgi:hypothetical protein
VISPSQRLLLTQDNKTHKDEGNILALNGIRAYDLSIQVIKAYASDFAATGTGLVDSV